jgi:acyl-CoA thioesterase FadM
MVLVITPRTIISIGRGIIKRRYDGRRGLDTNLSGIGRENPYVYNARVGLFDVDYLGHMNNAMYLCHAELARWEWTAYNEMLPKMRKISAHFLVKSCSVRYRQEIRPLFHPFQVDSFIAGLDDAHFWILQNFRDTSRDRAHAQVLVQGVVVKERQILKPQALLKEFGMNPDLIESVSINHLQDEFLQTAIESYSSFIDAMRSDASVDDMKRTSSP